jgi:hypothetical protein
MRGPVLEVWMCGKVALPPLFKTTFVVSAYMYCK